MEKKNVPSKMMQIFSVPDSLKILQEKVKSEFEGLSNLTMCMRHTIIYTSSILTHNLPSCARINTRLKNVIDSKKKIRDSPNPSQNNCVRFKVKR